MMGKLLYTVLDLFANNFVRKLLTSLGIGLATGLPFYLLISTTIDNATDQISSVSYVGLLAVFGIDTALSILFGAVLTRAYYEAMQLKITRR